MWMRDVSRREMLGTHAQTDRGFSVAHVVDEMVVPECMDLRTGAITCRTDRVHHFRYAPCLPYSRPRDPVARHRACTSTSLLASLSTQRDINI